MGCYDHPPFWWAQRLGAMGMAPWDGGWDAMGMLYPLVN